MNKKIKLLFSSALTVSMAASCLTAVPASADGIVPMVDGDTVIKEWKFDFGSADNVMEGYTAVTPDRNVITSKDYGFIGNDGMGYLVSPRYDSFKYQQGQTMNLVSGGNGENDGIGIEPQGDGGEKDYTTGDYYPVSFGMYVDRGSYYRVRATVTTLDPSEPAVASLYYERRHPVFNKKTIDAGDTYTVEFSVDVEDIYFEKSDPKGVFADDMLNISLLGDNAALASLEIQQIDESASNATTLWVLGDSTVTDGDASVPYFDLQNFTGVGAYLSKYVPSDVAVSNQGEGGLNANDNNHFNQVKNNIKEGDYMYVEYGHNHKNNLTQKFTGEYWLHNYVAALPKYYDACEAANATLVIVGPIGRITSSQYNSDTNTWSSTLQSFSDLGFKYVDCMLYSGKDTANAFIEKWGEIANAAEAGQDTASLKEAADKIWSDAIADGVKDGVSNIAFVDLNAPSLDWYESVTEKGIVNDVEVKNDYSLIKYYFQTSNSGVTDTTHPNDAGADRFAYSFFATADAEKYPAITPLLANFEEGAEHQEPVPVAAEIVNAGDKSKDFWPYYQPLIKYDYAAYIKSVNFDENGVLGSVVVQVQDNTMMSSYSNAYVAVYDKETGVLKKIAVSSNHVDNTNSGEITLPFNTDLTVGDNETYKVFLLSYSDDPEHGNPITMIPYASAYVPTNVEAYLISGESNKEAEDFTYYGKEYDGTVDINGINSWFVGGSAGKDTNLYKDETSNYVNIVSDGAKGGSAGQGSFYMLKSLDSEIGFSGTYMINADFKYISGGGLNIGFTNGYSTKSPFVTEQFTAFTIKNDGAVYIGDTKVGSISASSWTNVKYTLNMDAGKATMSIAGGNPVEVDVPEYMTTTAPEHKKLTAFVAEGQKVAFGVSMTNLQITKIKNDDVENKSVNITIPGDATGTGTVTINDESVTSKSFPQSTMVKLSAIPNDGSIFINWTNGDGSVVSSDPTFEYRLFDDLNVTANFAKQSGVDSVTDYDIVSNKGLLRKNSTATLTISNAVDSNGYPVTVEPSDVSWSCSEAGVTIDGDIITIGDDFAIDANTTKDISVKATVNNIEKTLTLTVYSYGFYENVKNGSTSSSWDGVATEIAGKNSIVFPGGGKTNTLTFDSPVKLSGEQTISYITGAAGADTCGQPRYIEFYDSNGVKVINDVIGYSWSVLYVGGTVGKSSIDGGTSLGDAAKIGSWTDTVTITINKATNTGTVSFNGTSAPITIDANSSDIASVKLISVSGAPAYDVRALAITELIITE